jgi:hypothetical protein
MEASAWNLNQNPKEKVARVVKPRFQPKFRNHRLFPQVIVDRSVDGSIPHPDGFARSTFCSIRSLRASIGWDDRNRGFQNLIAMNDVVRRGPRKPRIIVQNVSCSRLLAFSPVAVVARWDLRSFLQAFDSQSRRLFFSSLLESASLWSYVSLHARSRATESSVVETEREREREREREFEPFFFLLFTRPSTVQGSDNGVALSLCWYCLSVGGAFRTRWFGLVRFDRRNVKWVSLFHGLWGRSSAIWSTSSAVGIGNNLAINPKS